MRTRLFQQLVKRVVSVFWLPHSLQTTSLFNFSCDHRILRCELATVHETPARSRACFNGQQCQIPAAADLLLMVQNDVIHRI